MNIKVRNEFEICELCPTPTGLSCMQSGVLANKAP